MKRLEHGKAVEMDAPPDAQEADHARALINAEQAGYDRGVREVTEAANALQIKNDAILAASIKALGEIVVMVEHMNDEFAALIVRVESAEKSSIALGRIAAEFKANEIKLRAEIADLKQR